MKTDSRKNIILVLAVFFLISIFIASAILLARCTFSKDQKLPVDNGYVITNYDMNIKVNKKGVYHITETITADFLEESHGIVRYIPIIANANIPIDEETFETKDYKFSITNFRYDNPKHFEDSEHFRIFQLYADPNYQNVIGEHTFTFSYNYSIGDDRILEKDFVYFNMIGSSWDTKIENFTYTVTLPKTVENTAELYYGPWGETAKTSVAISLDGVTFKGTYTNIEPATAVTIYLSLPEGYFQYTRFNSMFDIAILVGILVLLVAFVIVIIKSSKKDPVIDVVEFAPPEKIDPTLAGYIIDKNIDGEDISALIVYWASKGYLKIIEEKKKLFIEKIKDLPSSEKKYQRVLFKAIFAKQTLVDTKKIKISDPNVGIEFTASLKKEGDKYFDDTGINRFKFSIVFMVIAYIVQLLRMYYENFSTYYLLLNILWAVGITVAVSYNIVLDSRVHKIKESIYITIKIALGIFIVGASIAKIVLSEAYCDPFFTRGLIALLPILLFVCSQFIETYSAEGRKMLGRIRGLKRFIEMAEKDRMIAMVESDPKLYYDILPYASVLGVTDVYINKIKDINLPPPEWVSSDTVGVYTYLYLRDLNYNLNFIGDTIKSAYFKEVAEKSYNSSRGFTGGGGFGGGGGFSGGGFGGGGGGRF